ncbi:MAG TPA: ABC transporter permease [Roseiarcus sp.]|nr:ABC transporter permease [Roseiarcus sp.]
MTDAVATTLPDAGRRGLVRWLLILSLPLLMVVMELSVYAVEPRVLSLRNVVNVLNQSSYIFVFASAQMMVILTRGFDLSLGAAVSSVSVASALAMTAVVGWGGSDFVVVAAGLLAGLGVGALVGLFNGAFVAGLEINAFVVTLGSLNICLGVATTISGGSPVFNVPDAFSRLFYNGVLIPGVSIPITIAIVLGFALYFLLNHTTFGRGLYLIGNNPRAARVAGLPSRRYLLFAYIACSLLAAFGALMLTARTGSGEPNLGGGLMLESIAAAVIGGVSLQGGVGGVGAVVFGALFVTMMSNSMDLLEVGGYVQQILLGCVIIVAIFLDRLRQTRT